MKGFNKTLLYWILTILFTLSVMFYGIYLINNNYISEGFTYSLTNPNTPETNHNVDQPINTTFSCKNMCGPLARCSITGEQCTSDIDCFGCMPKVSKQSTIYGGKYNEYDGHSGYVGYNESGKLTSGVTPTFSTLTTDVGTRASPVNASGELRRPPQYDQGVNVWKKLFNTEYDLFNQRYRPPKNLPNEPDYITRTTLSGEFKEDGPVASNSKL